jgi:DNA polymerase-1
MRTLYLIDAYAQIFRAYYAIRGGMRSPVTGEATHAVFGFTSMLLKLLGSLSPDHVIVAFDAPGPTFRDELYSAYKATRNDTPEDLTSQVPRIIELLDGFHLPLIGKAGLEADDVIATIVRRVLDDPECADVRIRLVSKDKDLEQLLCDRVSMFDIHTDTEIDVAGLWFNKGIKPEQVIDVLSLMGDTVDNVPGVDGIGPKTAAQLINEFGSLENLLANLDQVKGKKRESLEAARARLPLSRELVTLRVDPDLQYSLEHARVRPPDVNRLIPLFQQLGFNRFQDDVRRLSAQMGAVEAPAQHMVLRIEALPEEELDSYGPDRSDYSVVLSLLELNALVAFLRAAPIVAFDTETTGLGKNAELCGLSFSWKEGQGVYVPIRSPNPEQHLDEATVLSVLKPVLEDPDVLKCGHNLKFDAHQLLRHGIRLRGVVFDSLLASTLLDPGVAGHKLDILAQAHLGYRMISLSTLLGEGCEERTIDSVTLEEVAAYAAEDADIALRLYHVFCPRLREMQMEELLRDVEAPLSVVLAEMEAAGVLCDPEELLRQGEDLGARVGDLRSAVFHAAGTEFHIDSPRQLETVLFDQLGFTAGKKTKTGRSTDITVLEKLAAREDRSDPKSSVPRLIIEYRQLQKLISTYLGNLRESIDPETGRIHTTFHQLVTATGRLASHGPNLQNIPIRTDVGRQIRKAFPAPKGHVLICADYSQIELRILAHLSEDPGLMAAFAEGQDIHTAVAAQVFGVAPENVSKEQRSHAKTINFGIIYGVTPYGLARRIEGLDNASAAQLIDDYKRRFPGIDRFLADCIQHALQHGYVRTMLGRRRAIPEITSPNRATQALGERLAINSVVQGSAADLIKIAMVNVQRRIDRDGLPLRLLLQIHDELVLETPEELAQHHAEIVRQEMEQAMCLRVPLVAEAGVGCDWMTAK